MSRAALTASALTHAVLVLLIFSVTFPQATRQIRYRMTPLFAPEPKPPVPSIRRPAALPPRPLTIPPRLALPSVPVATHQPLPEPAIALPAAPPPPIETPRDIAPPAIRTGSFAPAPVSPAALPPPIRTVQTGTFGVADRATAAKPVTPQTLVASAGFGGPAAAEPLRATRSAVAATDAFGSAIPGTSPRATRSAAAATRAFGSAIPATAQPAARQQVAKAQFDSVVVKQAAPSSAKPVAAGRFTPLEILDKPRPAYSAEARRLQIEGEVVLEALFSASGRIRVMRVMRSLGHGLDENAIQAAAAIRFRPALENGSPTDMVAVVKIEFQLAY